MQLLSMCDLLVTRFLFVMRFASVLPRIPPRWWVLKRSGYKRSFVLNATPSANAIMVAQVLVVGKGILPRSPDCMLMPACSTGLSLSISLIGLRHDIG